MELENVFRMVIHIHVIVLRLILEEIARIWMLVSL